MIIKALLDLYFNMISLAFLPFNIPAAPEDFALALPQFLEYLEAGTSFFALVLPINIRPFFLIFSAIWGFRQGYHIIMWVLRKIPLAGME